MASTGSFQPRAHVVDVVALAVVPLALVAVFRLPTSTRLELALAYHEPTLASAYAMHFVHLSADHLLANLAAYLLVAPLTYALAVLAGRRDVFRIAFVAFLIAFPLVLSGLNVLLARPRIGFGFSGINMAFLGLLPLMLLSFLRHHAPGSFDFDHAPALFFAGIGLITALTVPSPRLRLAVAGFAAGSAVFYLRGLLPIRRLRADVLSLARTQGVEFAVAGLLVFGLLPIAAFPSDPVGDGTVLNLYTHLLGYCLGFISPYATVSILDRERAVPSAEAVPPVAPPEGDLDRFHG